jgi:hypothetical protein
VSLVACNSIDFQFANAACFDRSASSIRVMSKRNRSKSLKDRLFIWASKLRKQASVLPPGPSKDALLGKAGQADAAAEGWAEQSTPNPPNSADFLQRAKTYRDKAEECRQLASRAQNKAARDSYLMVAANYDKAANDVELLASLRRPNDRELR